MAGRRQWLAVTVIVGVAMLVGGVTSESPWISAAIAGLFGGLFLLVLLRLGFLATIATTILFVNGSIPLTPDFSAWYAGRGLLLFGLLFPLYAYACYISLGGRPIFQKSLLPE